MKQTVAAVALIAAAQASRLHSEELRIKENFGDISFNFDGWAPANQIETVKAAPVKAAPISLDLGIDIASKQAKIDFGQELSAAGLAKSEPLALEFTGDSLGLGLDLGDFDFGQPAAISNTISDIEIAETKVTSTPAVTSLAAGPVDDFGLTFAAEPELDIAPVSFGLDFDAQFGGLDKSVGNDLSLGKDLSFGQDLSIGKSIAEPVIADKPLDIGFGIDSFAFDSVAAPVETLAAPVETLAAPVAPLFKDELLIADAGVSLGEATLAAEVLSVDPILDEKVGLEKDIKVDLELEKAVEVENDLELHGTEHGIGGLSSLRSSFGFRGPRRRAAPAPVNYEY